MTEQFNPTEDAILAVLAKTGSDPRKLAIAYLRAQKRARDAEAAFNIMDGIAGMGIGLAKGDLGEFREGMAKGLKAGRTHKQATEKPS